LLTADADIGGNDVGMLSRLATVPLAPLFILLCFRSVLWS
jgi:hypothetical protein